jgi:hypothetical protein
MGADGSATVAPGSEDEGGRSIATVADQLGVSKDAVRRRLRSGQLGGHMIQTRHGPAWCVHLDSPVIDRRGSATPVSTVALGSRNGSATVAPGSDGLDLAALVVLVDRLERDNRDLAATAAVWQERAGQLSDRLAAAESRMAALEAPKSTLTASTAPAIAGTAQESSLARLRPLAPWVLAVLAVVVVGLLVWLR